MISLRLIRIRLRLQLRKSMRLINLADKCLSCRLIKRDFRLISMTLKLSMSRLPRKILFLSSRLRISREKASKFSREFKEDLNWKVRISRMARPSHLLKTQREI
jgi:hypothetical protein